ncbi:hypothetical protein [Phytohabitans suffuscus]|uniref:Uncharacterized protein n=1 Tax=Phytohabitans suffuscus TaxID=624315 RepID=A0A6F8YQH7_9ACTN|nr:hypothetical protein [Phytohabitans suffuscus]BCB88306.1 hypothetical protein Psuf_056190 [Phytohabitans suffuscus]
MSGDIAKALGQIAVDVRHLEGVGTYLDTLVRLLQKGQSCVRAADEATVSRGGRGGSAFGGYPVGGVPELHRKTDGTRVAVQRNLQNLVTACHDTAQALRDIAKEYKTVEERNKLDAAQVLNRLGRRR